MQTILRVLEVDLVSSPTGRTNLLPDGITFKKGKNIKVKKVCELFYDNKCFITNYNLIEEKAEIH